MLKLKSCIRISWRFRIVPELKGRKFVSKFKNHRISKLKYLSQTYVRSCEGSLHLIPPGHLSAKRSPLPWKLLMPPSPPTATSTTPIPFTNHRFLSKKGNCLKLKLSMSIIDVGGCGKKMEEGWGWDMLMKIILSHHFLEEMAPYPEPSGKSGAWGKGFQLGHHLSGHPENVTSLLGTSLCKVTPRPCSGLYSLNSERS